MEIRFALHDRGHRTDAGVMALASPDAGRRLLAKLRPHQALLAANDAPGARGSAELVAPCGTVLDAVDVPPEALRAMVLALSQVGQLRSV